MPLKINDTIDEPALNLTPMIDIVFLLIIFFMVGTQFTRDETQYDIQLPSVAAAQPLTSLPDEIIVSITSAGVILYNGEKQTLEQIAQQLAAAHENYADQAVVIRGDGQSAYQNIMNVMALCHRVGITNISLPAKIVSGEDG